MTDKVKPAKRGDRFGYYDTPWQRLPWTAPLAILMWSLALWGLSFLTMMNALKPQERTLPIEARIIDLPEPQANPQADPPEISPAPDQVMQHQKPPVAAPKRPSARPVLPKASAPVAQTVSEAEGAQPPLPSLPTVSSPQASATTPNTQRLASAQGTSVRAKSVGVIAPPPPLSIRNEESVSDDPFAKGLGLGGWMQESSEPCEFDHLMIFNYSLWQYKCGHIVRFSQPPNPWCYDAKPIISYSGTCGEDFDQAEDAYKQKDFATAFSAFKKLAEREYAPAQFNLGAMYEEGAGVPKDNEKAAYWYGKAAAEGDAKAIYNLAQMYNDGRGVPKDDQKAAFWYRKAAYFGYANAQYNLALMYALGLGVAQDDKQAAYWYRKSADRGNPSAQYNLAMMYAEGKGLPADKKQAVYWYCKAFVRSDEKARSKLIEAYSNETVSPADEELKYFCHLVSTSKRRGYQNAPPARELEKKLTPEQLSKVQNALGNWESK